MSVIHESLLYDAATNSLASDASSDNCWTKMVTASFANPEHHTFQKELKEVEKLIKSEYKISSMPSPWRSAKSIVLSALKEGISLTGVNGEILGKSHIQIKLKHLKTSADINLFKKVQACCLVVINNIKKLTPAERESVQAHLATMKDELHSCSSS